MSAYRVIDKLETVVRDGVWLPFGWRAINSDRVLDLIEKLRSTLPEDGSRTKKSVDAADRAGDVTSQTPPAGQVEETKNKAADRSDLITGAQARADEIVAQAQAAARDIRRGADEYADHVLASLDVSLGKALAAVQKGRQTLAMSVASGNGKKPREMSAL